MRPSVLSVVLVFQNYEKLTLLAGNLGELFDLVIVVRPRGVRDCPTIFRTALASQLCRGTSGRRSSRPGAWPRSGEEFEAIVALALVPIDDDDGFVEALPMSRSRDPQLTR